MKRIMKSSILAGVFTFLTLLQVSHAAQTTPVILIQRPAANEPYLNLHVFKDHGKIRLPFSKARVDITGPGRFSKTITADILGIARFDPMESLWSLEKRLDQMTFNAVVALGKVKTSKAITLSEEEINFYFKQAANALTDEGNRFAGEGDIRAALKSYQKALVYDPLNERASGNIALAYEKLGMYHLAVSSYASYLFLHPHATDRQRVKRKVIKLSKVMTPSPLISQKALQLYDQGAKAVHNRKYVEALAYYEATQSLVPFWPEPYYSAGLVFEYLTYQTNIESYSDRAVTNFGLFLEAADPKDARTGDAKRRIEDIRTIIEGLKAPRYIKVN